MDEHFDAIVLGGGPAGLTAGIYLARARVKTLIVDSGTAGGQMILSHAVANYPGVEQTTGAQLAQTMLRQAQGFGCQVLTQATVERLDLDGPTKTVVVEDEGSFTADAVIIATGGVPRTLGLESEARFKGIGISYCATCDGEFFTGMEIAAIGGGNSAIEEAISLAKYASKVTVIHELDHFQAQPWLVEEARNHPRIEFLMEQDVLRFEGQDNQLERVVTAHKQTKEVTETPISGAFVFIGYLPNTGSYRGIVELNERGEIVTDGSLETSLPGVFAAGDARVKRYRQITTAVSDGTVAALALIEYLHAQNEQKQAA